MGRRTWQVHLCLGCEFSKKVHALLPALRKEFGREFEIEVVLMALPWHFAAFHGLTICHAAAAMGCNRDAYIAACFERQEEFLNKATAALNREQIFEIFSNIAVEASGGVLSAAELTRIGLTRKPDYYMKAWGECKIGVVAGVTRSPMHVIDGLVVAGTDSAWGVSDYRAKLATLPAPVAGPSKAATALPHALAALGGAAVAVLALKVVKSRA